MVALLVAVLLLGKCAAPAGAACLDRWTKWAAVAVVGRSWTGTHFHLLIKKKETRTRLRKREPRFPFQLLVQDASGLVGLAHEFRDEQLVYKQAGNGVYQFALARQCVDGSNDVVLESMYVGMSTQRGGAGLRN